MTEFRDRDPLLMSFILKYFEEEGSSSSSSSSSSVAATHNHPGTVQSLENPALLAALLHEAEFFNLPHLAKRCSDALDLFALRRVDPALAGR